MKFLFTTDWHLSHKTPQSRVDDIMATQFRKLEDFVKIVEEENVDFILHGGDFFDSHQPNLVILNQVIDFLKSKKLPPMYVLPGNHDLFGGSLSSLKNSGVYSLYLAKVINLFCEPLYINSLKIFPVLPFQLNPSNLDISSDIFVIHDLVSPYSLPFKHTLCSDLDFSLNKIFLLGDFHQNFEYKGKSVFLNPGCLVRRSISEKEVEGGVYIIDPKSSKWEKRRIKQEGNVFLEETIEKDLPKFDFLKGEIPSFNFNLYDLVMKVATDRKLSQESLNYLREELKKYV